MRFLFIFLFVATVCYADNNTREMKRGSEYSERRNREIRDCKKKVKVPQKTFKYYQQQFHMMEANQMLAVPRGDDKVWGHDTTLAGSGVAISLEGDISICKSGQDCMRPIGSIAIRLKVVGGKVVDRLVEERDYGWCDFNKTCISTEQLVEYHDCFYKDLYHSNWLYNYLRQVENITITRPLLDGERTVWFQIGTDNFLKNNSVVEAEVE